VIVVSENRSEALARLDVFVGDDFALSYRRAS
jgi:hypothetical protein